MPLDTIAGLVDLASDVSGGGEIVEGCFDRRSRVRRWAARGFVLLIVLALAVVLAISFAG